MKHNNQSGLIKLIIFIVALVLIASYFGVNIQKIAESETGQANFAYLWSIVQKIGDWFWQLYQNQLAPHLEPLKGYLPKFLVK